MSFKETFEEIKLILNSIGSNIPSDAMYDGILVKQLKKTNTLVKDRASHQSHIAITGEQMDMFPCICSHGYFDCDYDSIDNILKKYFVAQVPFVLHDENLKYLNPALLEKKNKANEVYVSIVRSRRNGAKDQIQMSITELDSPLFINFRKSMHTGDYLVILKRRKELLYDCYAVKANDKTYNNVSLVNYNGNFEKTGSKKDNTIVKVDKILKSKDSNDELQSFSHNRIFFGAPGTGKSYQLNKQANELFRKENISRVTLYPDYTYSQFVGCYKPCTDEEGNITYGYVPGPFLDTYLKAYTHPTDQYVLIIEEINRANPASVFGDVFQLLDRKSDGFSEYPVAISNDMKKYIVNYFSKLSDDEKKSIEDYYDEMEFNDFVSQSAEYLLLPPNMYIWATMNSADQGVFPMDTAFKRRWDFEYIGINDGETATVEIEDAKKALDEIRVSWGNGKHTANWNSLRKAINDFLSKDVKVNEDKLLGPFFVSPENLNEERFGTVFKDKVLLYLFEDACKTKRSQVFTSNLNTYSEVCEAFDERGVGIFIDGFKAYYKEDKFENNEDDNFQEE